MPAMSQVFISYRRDDSGYATDMLYDRLVVALGRDNLFKDIDSIPLGVDFRNEIDAAIGRCQVVLVVIGKHWLTITDATGNARLNDPKDFVRLEVESALERGIPVIPVLLEGVAVPPPEQLPASLRSLSVRHAINVGRGSHFDVDVKRLIENIRLLLSGSADAQKSRDKAKAKNHDSDDEFIYDDDEDEDEGIDMSSSVVVFIKEDDVNEDDKSHSEVVVLDEEEDEEAASQSHAPRSNIPDINCPRCGTHILLPGYLPPVAMCSKCSHVYAIELGEDKSEISLRERPELGPRQNSRNPRAVWLRVLGVLIVLLVGVMLYLQFMGE
jgi:hypothetical protein